MSDDANRMFDEALERLNDAEILDRSTQTSSDSSALLRILAFEILLKCAIRLSGQTAKPHHNYAKLWLALPRYVSKEILLVAKDPLHGNTDFSDLTKLLNWYQFIFEKARYHYELYEGYTFAEQRELGELWVALGSPTHEAVVQYHPQELFCLIEGLKAHVGRQLSNNAMQAT
jgi:hypothetical protein